MPTLVGLFNAEIRFFCKLGCSPEDLPEAMNDKEKCRERVRDIHASGMTWWWMNDMIQLFLFINNNLQTFKWFQVINIFCK